MFRLSFAVTALVTSAIAQGVIEGVEPNDSVATATALPNGQQAYGDITAGDEDWFKVTLVTASDYRIWTAPGFSGQIGDTRVRILAGDGVTEIVDEDDGNPATHGAYTVFDGTLAAGVYYIAVRGFDATTVGSYTLDAVFAAPGTYVPANPPLTGASEGPENNDPRPAFGGGVATVASYFTRSLGDIVAGGSSGTGITTIGKDYDWYEINVTAPGIYVFRTTATPQAPVPFVNDTVLHLCDAGYTRLAWNDDFNSTYSQLSYNVTAPGTYYVVVSGYYSISNGSYYLDILGLPPPVPTGAATVTLHPGGCNGTAGTPLLETRLSSTGSNVRPERAVTGSQYWLDGTNLPPNAVVFQVIGILALASPFDLGAAGAPGCFVEVAPLDQSIALADPTGVFFWRMAIPGDLSLTGLPLEQQLVAYDPGANPLGVTVSNRVSSVLGVTH